MDRALWRRRSSCSKSKTKTHLSVFIACVWDVWLVTNLLVQQLGWFRILSSKALVLIVTWFLTRQLNKLGGITLCLGFNNVACLLGINKIPTTVIMLLPLTADVHSRNKRLKHPKAQSPTVSCDHRKQGCK
ncbi:hypothetical protein V6N13_139658 [Hibiscus sabdariffa]|uniref:Uncharacterized protein n=1 Tax=Hibiscus sabdariffa TaxID=183260 RepID=A0ABR2C7G3_9ROSI